MAFISQPEFQSDFDRYADEAVASRALLRVSRPDGRGDIVVMSAAEFASWEETCFFLSDPKRADHLRHSIAQANAGELTERQLIQRPDSDGG